MLTNSQLLVLFGCIPLRMALAYISTLIPEKYKTLFGIVLMSMGLGFLYIYFTNTRLNAPESGTGVSWWHNLRLIHGALYVVAAIYALQHSDLVWVPLTIDITFGIFVFFFHYNFKLI
jgi:hypothetical protein